MDGMSHWDAIQNLEETKRTEFIYNLDDMNPPVTGHAAIRYALDPLKQQKSCGDNIFFIEDTGEGVLECYTVCVPQRDIFFKLAYLTDGRTAINSN